MLSRVKTTIRIAAPALFAFFCSGAFAAPQPYRVAPPPSWVVPAADAPLAHAKPVEAGDFDYLMVDQQVRLTAVTEQYSRYVERMVNQASVDRAAQVSIEIDPSHERLLLHDVRVFRDGRAIDKLADARRSLLNRESELDEGLINGRLTLHLLLQDVRVGDVLDYAFTLERRDPFGERGYNNWFSTQWGTPVRRFRLRVQHPADRTLQIRDHSKLPKPSVTRHGAWVETIWDASDVPGLPGEESRPAWHLFYPRIELSEFADWQAVRAWALPMYELRPKQDAALQAFIAELEAEPDEAKRLLRALRFVQDDIRYTGLEIGVGAYRPTQPSEVLARRFGDCKDKVLLLVTLLRALGVDAYPALVSSRLGRGIDNRLPGPGAFDHVIAKVRWKDRDYWLDATASGQGGRFDTTIQANFERALVLDSSRDGLVNIPVRQARVPTNHVVETFDLREGTRKQAKLSVTTTYCDEEADSMRVRMRTRTATELGKEYLEYYRKSYAGIQQVKPLTLSDDRDANVYTLTETYQIEAPFEEKAPGEWKFHLEAYLVSDRTGVPKQTDRTTPLARRFPMHVRHQIVAYLPGKWAIDPQEVKIADPAFEYHSTTGFAKGTLSLDYELSNTRDHVPVAGLKPFLVNLDKAHDDAFFTLTEGDEDRDATTAQAPAGPSIHMIATLLAGLGVGAALAFWLARPRWRLADAEPNAPKGFSGWLVLPVIGVSCGPFLLGYSIWAWFEQLGTAAQYASTAESVRWMVLLQFGVVGATMPVSLMTAWLLFRRMRMFPFAFIALQVLTGSVLVIDMVTLLSMGESLASSGYEGNRMIMRVLVAALWIGYMLVSQRVRATFVNPGRDEHSGAALSAASPAAG